MKLTLSLCALVTAAFGGAMVGHFASGTGPQASTSPSAIHYASFI